MATELDPVTVEWRWSGRVLREVVSRTKLPKETVKKAWAEYVLLAVSELKKNGRFKIGGYLNLKLKRERARPARKGVSPLTKEPCVFYPKPASYTVHGLPMKKFNEMINS